MMAKGDETDSSPSSSEHVKTTNTSNLTIIECKQIIDDMSNEIYNLRIFLKSFAKENTRTKGANDFAC